MDFDASWCPVCEQQIAPKRIQVAVPTQQPTMPAPPPSSPQSSPTSKPSTQARRTKLRTKGGLVQGTGRARPNGTIKRTDSASKAQQPAQPPAPVKYRTVIDQSPIPLYCSDQCRLADLGSIHRGRPVNPSQSTSEYDDLDLSDSSSDYAESSRSSSSKPDYSHIDPSVVKLAQIYNFPLPPPVPTFQDDSSDSESYSTYRNSYNSGVMMAGKRIREFCPKPKKQTGLYPPAPEPKQHIPGWTDNTQGWRSTVYSLSSPKSNSDPTRTITPATFRASRRSSSVASTSYSPAPSDEDLLNKYSESFARRAEARASRSSASGSPSSARSPSVGRRERSLVHPGAEGKLLVPDVKLKVNSASTSSLSSMLSGSSRPSVRSPLSTSSICSDEETDTQRCDSAASLPTTFKRPSIETRSWSYDNVKTYPLMPMQRKMIKRIEKRIVDGEEIEVEVQVPEPLKRLFLFPAVLA
ncbi:hypothetical protein CC2G_013059 [Coprinopsis cinerea AmutBmut pab1-1]|nr:hypothetical protein CC2G_013059 [Coprinopsis cinerea AmutBmut pab1-1]